MRRIVQMVVVDRPLEYVRMLSLANPKSAMIDTYELAADMK
jgi:hypothetical protein